LAAGDRSRREGFENQSKLQSQSFAEANARKTGDRGAAMAAFLRFRAGG
jgi:hypothetical protein